MLGIVGAHRVGKSTLAKAVAEKSALPYVQTDAKGWFMEQGLDPKLVFDFRERLRIQILLLDAMCERHWKGAPGNAITDRSPLDLLMYTLADVQGHTLDAETEGVLASYTDACFRAVNHHFHALVLVQPGIPLIEEPGKAALSPGYIAHLNALMMGLLLDERLEAKHYYIPRYITDLAMRIEAVEKVWKRTVEVSMTERLQGSTASLLH